jgi:hypothetical protein
MSGLEQGRVIFIFKNNLHLLRTLKLSFTYPVLSHLSLTTTPGACVKSDILET